MKKIIILLIGLLLLPIVAADFNFREDVNFRNLYEIKNSTNITAIDTVLTPQLCLTGDVCRTSWPIGSGSGDNTSWNESYANTLYVIY